MTTNPKNLIVLRADGDNKMGLGHIYRLLAVSEMLKERFRFVFISRCDEIVAEIIRGYCELIILPAHLSLEDEVIELKPIFGKGHAVILDGYHFNSNYQCEVKRYARFVIVFDDLCDKMFHANLVINHSQSGLQQQYKALTDAIILAGPQYVVLRQEFLRCANVTREIANTGTLLVCFGGSDPYNLTLKALNAALKLDFINKIILITGAAYQRNDLLDSLVNQNSEFVFHYSSLNAQQMIDLIAQSSIALCTASTIALEICCVRSGLMVGPIEVNQLMLYTELTTTGCALGFKDLRDCDVDELATEIQRLNNMTVIQQQIKNQNSIFDGRSAERLSEAVVKLTGS